MLILRDRLARSYLLRFLGFAFPADLCGAGGAESMRRSTSSARGIGCCLSDVFMVGF